MYLYCCCCHFLPTAATPVIAMKSKSFDNGVKYNVHWTTWPPVCFFSHSMRISIWIKTIVGRIMRSVHTYIMHSKRTNVMMKSFVFKRSWANTQHFTRTRFTHLNLIVSAYTLIISMRCSLFLGGGGASAANFARQFQKYENAKNSDTVKRGHRLVSIYNYIEWFLEAFENPYAHTSRCSLFDFNFVIKSIATRRLPISIFNAVHIAIPMCKCECARVNLCVQIFGH